MSEEKLWCDAFQRMLNLWDTLDSRKLTTYEEGAESNEEVERALHLLLLVEMEVDWARKKLQACLCPCCGSNPHKMSCYPEMRKEKLK